MGNNLESVWAIVLMYGGEQVTADCIDSLLAQDYPALTVLLADNASVDGSGERLRDRYSQIRYLNTGANHGYAGGNNRGMEFALANGAEYLLVVNNDTVLQPDCVTQLMHTCCTAERAGAVSPKILFYDDPRRIWFGGGDFSMLRAIGTHRRELEEDDALAADGLEEAGFLTGCCMLLHGSVVRAVGGFREDFFMYCEDVELSVRLRRAGYRLYYQPRARMLHRTHPVRQLPTPLATMHRDRNRRRIVREYYSPVQRALFALWFYPTRAVRLVQYLLRGDLAGMRAVLMGAVAR